MNQRKLNKIIYFFAIGLFLSLTPKVSAQFILSGTVTDSNSVPIPSVEVRLNDEFGSPIGIPFTQTNASGFYSISGLPTGIFGLEFIPLVQGHIGETFPVVNVSGNTTFDVMLATGFHLSGFVRDSLGQGIFDIDLNVYEQISGNKLTTSGDNTDINGFYHITVPGGEYRIRYRAVGPFAEPWVPIELSNKMIVSDTTFDVNLEIGVVVSGTILQPDFNPAVNADLDFVNSTTGILQITPSDNTDGSGFYSVILPTETFDVTVTPQNGDPFLPLIDNGVIITGTTTLDYTLDAGFLITGIVSNSLSIPIQTVDIDIVDSTTGVKLITPGDKTDASGFYQVLVPSGTYNLIYQPQVVTGLAPFQIFGVNITSNINQDVVLTDGILLSGILQNTAGNAVVNSDIDVKISATGIKIPVVGDKTDAFGAFTVVVVPDTYNIEFEPLVTDFLTSSILKNLTLTVDTLLNITLDTGLVLSGTVLDSASSPISNVEITAVYFNSLDTVYTQFNSSDLTGQYAIYIPSGNFDIFFKTDTLSGFIDSTEVLNYTMTTNSVLNVSFSSGQPDCCIVNRGNVDGGPDDGTFIGSVDISDLVFLVAFMFQNGAIPPCIEEADINGSTNIDISDLVTLVAFMFQSGTPPVSCF